MCFAYKIAQPITAVTFQVQDLLGNIMNAQASLNTTADMAWHYTCVDLYAGMKASQGGASFTTPAPQLTLLSVRISFSIFFLRFSHMLFFLIFLSSLKP